MLTASLGSPTFEVSYGGIAVARIIVDDLVIVPGDNVLRIEAMLLRESFLNNPIIASELFSVIIAGHEVEYLVTGLGTVAHDRKIAWLTTFVKSFIIKAQYHRNKIDFLQDMILSNTELLLTAVGGTVSSNITAKLKCSIPIPVIFHCSSSDIPLANISDGHRISFSF